MCAVLVCKRCEPIFNETHTTRFSFGNRALFVVDCNTCGSMLINTAGGSVVWKVESRLKYAETPATTTRESTEHWEQQ